MSVSDWLLGTLCVLAFIIVIQVGMVWRILDNILNCVGWIKDIWRSIINIQGNIINIRDKLGAKPSKWQLQETNMDHLKALNSDHEMAVLMEEKPWCTVRTDGEGFCKHLGDEGGWRTWCPDCCAKWLSEPYKEDKKR